MVRLRVLLAFSLILWATVSFALGPIDMLVMPVFGQSWVGLKNPVEVRLVNSGPEADGAVYTGPLGNRTAFPFHLAPHGSKLLKVYCPYEPPDNLDSQRGRRNAIRVEFQARSNGGETSSGAQTVELITPEFPTLAITTDRKAVSFLKGYFWLSRRPGESKSDFGVRQNKNQKVDLLTITPVHALERGNFYRSFRWILLGEGTGKLSENQVNALKEYVVTGGVLVFSPGAETAESDPRWHRLLSNFRTSTSVGLGSILKLSYPVETSANYTKQLQDEIKSFYDRRLATSSLGLLNDADSLLSSAASNPQQGPDPFKLKLPSFSAVAFAVLGYFVLVIPVNILILRKIRKPELSWITSPALAVVFSAVIFKTASKLGESPPSLSAAGSIVTTPELDREVVRCQFDLFSPKAATFGLNLKDAQDLQPYYTSEGSLSNREPTMPEATDNGSVDIPNFRSANLQFKSMLETASPPRQDFVRFSVRPAEPGIFMVAAENIGSRPIYNVEFVAGDYTSVGRTLEPGKRIEIPVDHVSPAPMQDYNELVEQRNSASSASPTNQTRSSSNTELLMAAARVKGQVALSGELRDFPIGPHLAGNIQYRSRVILTTFAPLDMKLP